MCLLSGLFCNNCCRSSLDQRVAMRTVNAGGCCNERKSCCCCCCCDRDCDSCPRRGDYNWR